MFLTFLTSIFFFLPKIDPPLWISVDWTHLISQHSSLCIDWTCAAANLQGEQATSLWCVFWIFKCMYTYTIDEVAPPTCYSTFKCYYNSFLYEYITPTHCFTLIVFTLTSVLLLIFIPYLNPLPSFLLHLENDLSAITGSQGFWQSFLPF